MTTTPLLKSLEELYKLPKDEQAKFLASLFKRVPDARERSMR